MGYALENALYQWEEGERRLREVPDGLRRRLEGGVDAVLEELRRRLGSTFSVDELADLYGSGTDWAAEVAQPHVPVGEGADVVDAAFSRYARGASDYGGGRARPGGRRF